MSRSNVGRSRWNAPCERLHTFTSTKNVNCAFERARPRSNARVRTLAYVRIDSECELRVQPYSNTIGRI
jgi:hypothetical protein